MGRIVTPLGAGQSFFGRKNRVRFDTGPITTVNPITAIGQGALATSAGVKAIEGVADLAIKGYSAIKGGIDRGKAADARQKAAAELIGELPDVPDTSSFLEMNVPQASQRLSLDPRLVGSQPSAGSGTFRVAEVGSPAPEVIRGDDTARPPEFDETVPMTTQIAASFNPSTRGLLERTRAQGVPMEPVNTPRGMAYLRKLQQMDPAQRLDAIDTALSELRLYAGQERYAGKTPQGFNQFGVDDFSIAMQPQAPQLSVPQVGMPVAPQVAAPIAQPQARTAVTPMATPLARAQLPGLGDISSLDAGGLINRARATTNPMEQQALVQAAEFRAYPASLKDLATGSHIVNLQKQIISEFPKPEKPPKPPSELDQARAEKAREEARKIRFEVDKAALKLARTANNASKVRGASEADRGLMGDAREWVLEAIRSQSGRGVYADLTQSERQELFASRIKGTRFGEITEPTAFKVLVSAAEDQLSRKGKKLYKKSLRDMKSESDSADRIQRGALSKSEGKPAPAPAAPREASPNQKAEAKKQNAQLREKIRGKGVDDDVTIDGEKFKVRVVKQIIEANNELIEGSSPVVVDEVIDMGTP